MRDLRVSAPINFLVLPGAVAGTPPDRRVPQPVRASTPPLMAGPPLLSVRCRCGASGFLPLTPPLCTVQLRALSRKHAVPCVPCFFYAFPPPHSPTHTQARLAPTASLGRPSQCPASLGGTTRAPALRAVRCAPWAALVRGPGGRRVLAPVRRTKDILMWRIGFVQGTPRG
jgi:hypothetical protein